MQSIREHPAPNYPGRIFLQEDCVVTLKLRVVPSLFAALFDELKKNPNRFQVVRKAADAGLVGLHTSQENFVTIMPGERKFDQSTIELVLQLEEHVRNDEKSKDGDVKRESVDALFDFLGVFPRGTESPTEKLMRQALTSISVLADGMAKQFFEEARSRGESRTILEMKAFDTVNTIKHHCERLEL